MSARLRPAAPLLFALLAACGGDKPDTTMTTQDGKVSVSTSGDGDSKVTVTATDGDKTAKMVSGGGAKWPESAPAFAAAYPGGTLITVMAGNADGKASGMATFETTDAPDKVIAFYKDKAAAAGLTKVTSMAGNGMTMFGASDESGDRVLSVQASPGGGKTTGSGTFAEPAKG